MIVAVDDPVRAPTVRVLAVVTIDYDRGTELKMTEGVATFEGDIELEVEDEDCLVLERGRSVVILTRVHEREWNK